ncbi:putative Rho GTPase-activating protein 39 [Blattamonas nauphoetae]|uniref:Rho GTPase-activating protein 39 n=1 Tax=Blattamonas nauphoetae TaxID=2049346 RepID=A0ABQ9YDB5_9EUKA|nr:putative Rho GTPase-activating protein 39 [Blattamonas nauphoetae]
METPLPPGWKQAVDAKTGRNYYFNKQLNIRTWTRPTDEEPSPAEQPSVPLPDGWEAKTDRSSGKVFYINKEKRMSTWNHPDTFQLSKQLNEESSQENPPPVSSPPPSNPPQPEPQVLPTPSQPHPTPPSFSKLPQPAPPPSASSDQYSPLNRPPLKHSVSASSLITSPPVPERRPSVLPTGGPPPVPRRPPPPPVRSKHSATVVSATSGGAFDGMSAHSSQSELQKPTPHSRNSSYLLQQQLPSSGYPLRGLPGDLKNAIHNFKIEGFAKEHFATHKRGIFKRKVVSVEQLLVYQSQPIKQALLSSVEKKNGKTAVKNFEDILAFMAGKQTKVTKSSIADRIIKRGITKPELRDEIFAQLCKQTNTKNSSQDSATKETLPFENRLRAWYLLVFCCEHFGPSMDFERTLLSYLDSAMDPSTATDNRNEGLNAEEAEKVSVYAQYAFNKLYQTLCDGEKKKLGQSGSNETTGITEGTLAELSQLSNSCIVFGVSLEDLMFRQTQPHFFEKCEAEHPKGGLWQKMSDIPLPFILPYLTIKIIHTGGLTVEGIFRKCVTVTELQAAISALNNGKYALSSADPHLYAVLLKTWLKQLSQPLIPSHFYPTILELVTAYQSNRPDTTKIAEILNCEEHNIPGVEQACVHFAWSNIAPMPLLILKYIMRFLRLVLQEQYVIHTRMDEHNILLMFSPNLLRSPSVNPLEALENLKKELVFIGGLLHGLEGGEEEERQFADMERSVLQCVS